MKNKTIVNYSSNAAIVFQQKWEKVVETGWLE